MKKFLFYFLFSCLFLACKSSNKIKLDYLDEYVLADSTKFQTSIIGGLSGIDYANGFYYLVIDDTHNPRFLKAKIDLEKNKIKAINFKKVVFLNDSTTNFYKENVLDLESIFVDPITKEVNITSEGSIVKGKDPLIFETDSLGHFIKNYTILKQFKANSDSKPENNATFEGSSKSIDKKGFWVSMEDPLAIDGKQPSFKPSSSPIRITYYDKITEKPTKQFAYQLGYITEPAKGKMNVNGASAILEYKKNHFFIVERTFLSGYVGHGNIIRIFEASIDDKTTNILGIKSLKKSKYIPLKKRLLFDFEDVKNQLTKGIIDNIEGITFGPKLANGNQSLLLVTDDNFQKYGKQLNQFVLLEIENK